MTAIFLVLLWQFPLTFGMENVFSAILLTFLELPALMALSGLFMLHMNASLADKIKAAACVCGALYIIGLGATVALQALPSAWLLVSIFWILASKALIYTTTRRESTWTIEGIRLAIHLFVFLLVISIARDLSLILQGGFTGEALQALSLPKVAFDRLPPNSPWIQPSWFIVAGAAYFLLCAIFRYTMSPHKPGGQERNDLATTNRATHNGARDR